MLGEPNIICIVIETKINYDVKSHRGRGLINLIWLFVFLDTSTSPSIDYC